MTGKHDSDEVYLSNVAMPSIPYTICTTQETNTPESTGDLARSPNKWNTYIYFKYLPNASYFSVEENIKIICTNVYIGRKFSLIALPIYLRRGITLCQG